MANVKDLGFIDILRDLPDIVPLDCAKHLAMDDCDIFVCALGFEERCLAIPERLADVGVFRCKQALYFEFSTNSQDNEVNKPRLLGAFQKFADSCTSVSCDEANFPNNLRGILGGIPKSDRRLKIIFDMSVCSSKLLVSAVRVLLEDDLDLRVVYSEAAVYHPTKEEFEKEPEKWTAEEGFGIARGVGRVVPSPEYPGLRRGNPDMIVAFPTFKPERTKAIITDVDESILVRPEKRIIYVVGDPNMNEEERKIRKDIIRRINSINESFLSMEASTLNYKDTIAVLEKIYLEKALCYHINIAALGSKMQSLGISLFCYARPDVSVYLAIPREYNPTQYSEGCKQTWQILFGDLGNLRKILSRVGTLEIVKN